MIRTFTCFIAGVSLILGGCSRSPVSSASQEAENARTLRLSKLINVDVRDVPLMMALDDLTGQGYKIEKTLMVSSPLMAEALTRGDADIAIFNNQMAWTAISKGARIRTIAEFTASTTVMVAKDEIHSCRELDGRKMGVASTGGVGPVLQAEYFKRHCPGISPAIMVIPESAARAAALLKGEVDALVVPRGEFLKVQLAAPGKFRELMSYVAEFPDIHIDGVQVSLQWANRNPQGVKDFLKALLRAHRQVVANPKLLFDAAVEKLSLEPDTARMISRAHLRMNIWDANGGLTEKGLQDTISFLAGAGVLPAGLKPGDVADLSYLNAVLDEIGRR